MRYLSAFVLIVGAVMAQAVDATLTLACQGSVTIKSRAFCCGYLGPFLESCRLIR